MTAVDEKRATQTKVARKITARDDVKPSGRQRAYIARLALELLGVDFPESRRDAAQIIERLLAARETASVDASDPSIPF